MSLSCGILGLPNVGKSTFFNALSGQAAAEVANYPFCTIDPQKTRVPVHDARLHTLARLSQSKSVIPTYVEIMDIAGLVKGASAGEGLGNQFLGHVREVDALLHVVRCFDHEDIVHVSGRVDPSSDYDVIDTELLLADLESVTRRLPGLAKKAKQTPDEWAATHQVMDKARAYLEEGVPLRRAAFEADERPLVAALGMLTFKPVLCVLNVPETDILSGNDWTKVMEEKLGPAPSLRVSAAIEAELSVMPEADREVFLADLGLKESSLHRLVRQAHGLLNLHTFFTTGPQETRAWSFPTGATAPEAAGLIHTDFERGFIAADVCAYDDFVHAGGEAQARTEGKLRLQGRDYDMQDGDVVHFRFNV